MLLASLFGLGLYEGLQIAVVESAHMNPTLVRRKGLKRASKLIKKLVRTHYLTYTTNNKYTVTVAVSNAVYTGCQFQCATVRVYGTVCACAFSKRNTTCIQHALVYNSSVFLVLCTYMRFALWYGTGS